MLIDNPLAHASYFELFPDDGVFDRIAGELSDSDPYFFYETAEARSRAPLYSILGWTRNGRIRNNIDSGHLTPPNNFEALVQAVGEPLPFWGGVVGYIPAAGPAASDNMAAYFLPDRLLVRNQLTGAGFLIGFGPSPEAISDGKLREEFEQLTAPSRHIGSGLTSRDQREWESSLSKSEYCIAVDETKRAIQAGLAEQVIISIGFSTQYGGKAFPLYRSLRKINTAPHNFFLHLPPISLFGTPPSTYLSIRDNIVTIEVGAGTRPMTGNPETDDAAAADLKSDAKELHEHFILVDQARSALEPISKPNTIVTDALAEVRRFSHVMHLFTVLKSELKEIALMRALAETLPAAPAIGVPTAAAAKIVAAVERRSRGPYSGVYFAEGFDGSLTSAIVERSMWLQEGRLNLRVGAGITTGSDPDAEYAECLQKAKALMAAVARLEK